MWSVIVPALLATSALARPTGDRPISEHQARVIADAILEARSAGKDARSILGDLGSIFGIGDNSYNTDSTSYAPYVTSCPSGSIDWVRNATSLSSIETEYLQQRASQLNSTWQQRLSSQGLSSPRTPNIAVALSGGGYRAMINGAGAGFLQNSTLGSVGDILSLANYASGLSGGSWALTSFYGNDGQSPDYLVQNVWNLDSNLVLPDDAFSFYYDILKEVAVKRDDTPFSTEITDYWSLALTDHLFPSEYHSNNHPNFTFSELRNLSSIKNASLPFPIVVAAERQPGETLVSYNATLWEFNLGEWGAWHFGSANKTTGAFTPLEWLGTNISNGQLVDSSRCWKGYDNIGFVAGTSSTLFNQALVQIEQTNSSSVIAGIVEEILGSISSQYNDVATYPNSFRGYGSDYSPIANLPNITLVDGGEPNTNIPIEPFLESVRNIDAIVAIDSSADTTYSWPNGSSLWTSYQRSLGLIREYDLTQRMPVVPSTNGFINGGWNSHPTFFGCNDTSVPIIVYVPNYPWSAWSNTSTFMLEYSTDEASAILTNGRRTLDLNGTASDWPTCLTCAFIDNAIQESNGSRSATCQSCFDRFCWDGQDNSTQPTEYEPVIGQVPPTMP